MGGFEGGRKENLQYESPQHGKKTPRMVPGAPKELTIARL